MFEMKRTVTYSQVGSGLTMDMAGVVQYLQDCVLAHSESIGRGLDHVAGTKRAWFLSSWQIEVVRFPEYKENVTVRTWPHDFKSMYGYRNFDILDSEGTPVVCANSIWIFMDLAKLCPTKPKEDDMRGYELEEALEMEYAPRKIRQLTEEYRVGADYREIVIRRSFLDSNNHVNNGRYVSEALDLIDRSDVKKMRVDYRKAAVLGDIMYPVVYKNDELTQVVLNDSDGKAYVIVEVGV